MNILKKKSFWLSVIAILALIFVITFNNLKPANNENSEGFGSSSFSSSTELDLQSSSDLSSNDSTENSQENSTESTQENVSSSTPPTDALDNDVTVINQNVTTLSIPKLDLSYPSNMNVSESASGLYNNYIFSRENGISLVISTSEPFGTDAGGYCSNEYNQINDKVVRLKTNSTNGTVFRYSPSTQTLFKGAEGFDRQLQLLPINGNVEDQKACVSLLPRFTKNIDQTEMWVIGRIEQNCTSCVENVAEYENILLGVLENSLQ